MGLAELLERAELGLDRNMDTQLNIHIGVVAGIVELAEFVVGRNTV